MNLNNRTFQIIFLLQILTVESIVPVSFGDRFRGLF